MVAPRDSHTRGGVSRVAGGHIGKVAAVVPQELVGPVVGDVEIEVTVIVVITPNGRVAVYRAEGSGGQVAEGVVAVVSKEPVRGSVVDKVEVEVSVVVVVCPRD